MLRHVLYSLILLGLPHGPSFGEPMDLFDPSPRVVGVEFEVSPRDRPGQLDAIYTGRFEARLEPGDVAGQVIVSVEGRVVEEQLLGDREPLAGSFSEYVWVFDVTTGHVISASVSGTLLERVKWGPIRTTVETDVRIEMGTEDVSGYTRPRHLFGQKIFFWCATAQPECTLVQPVAYDPASGYVNAVGRIEVRAPALNTRSFSPLGEAVFSEWGQESLASELQGGPVLD